MEKEVLLHIDNISKKYKNNIVLEDISFDVYKGEFLSILGPSGCGKTTLLRILIGIDTVSGGKIFKLGQDITELAPSKRNIGIVFQNYSLFPNLNVYNNIAYALKARKINKEEIKKQVNEIIELVGLSDHIYKFPRHLSGGQKQRVAIARTLVLKPDIILFDEPMSALDADIKVILRKQLKEIQSKMGITMIYVTHDQEEAFALSDRVMVINDSRIAQLDTPHNIYKNPSSDFVKRFIIDHLDYKIKSIEESIHE